MPRFASTILGCAIVLATASAWAQRPDAPANESPTAPTGWLARPWIVEAQLGGGAPLGTAGVALGYTPVAWATISGGVGLAQGQAQGAVMPRIHQPLTDTLGLAVGAGISFGPTSGSGRDALRRVFCASCDDIVERTYAFAWWGNAEVSLEERRPWGLMWRVFFGGARVLNPSEGSCDAGVCADHRVVAYAGVAAGWTFSL